MAPPKSELPEVTIARTSRSASRRTNRLLAGATVLALAVSVTVPTIETFLIRGTQIHGSSISKCQLKAQNEVLTDLGDLANNLPIQYRHPVICKP